MQASLEERVLRVAVFDGVDISVLEESTPYLAPGSRVAYVPIEESYDEDRQDELVEVMHGFDGAVFRSGTEFKGALEELTELQFLARAGIGVGNVNIPLASKNGTIVYFAPDSNSISVAELVYFQLGELERKPGWQHQQLQDGMLEAHVKRGALGQDLAGKTMAVLGLGNIGSKVVVRGLTWGLDFGLYDPIKSEDEILAKLNTQLKSTPVALRNGHGLNIGEWENIIMDADYVTVHLPEQYYPGFIDAEKIAKMKDGAVLINDSRAGIIDEMAVLDALNSGKLRAYLTDLPPALSEELFNHPNILMTAHTGAQTQQSKRKTARMIGESIAGHTRKETLRSYNQPVIDDEIKEPYDLTRILAAFATHYVDRIDDAIKLISVEVRGLPSLNSAAFRMAAAAGAAYAFGLSNGNGDLPSESMLLERKIGVKAKGSERATRGVAYDISLEYELESGVTLNFRGRFDPIREDNNYVVDGIAGFVGSGTTLDACQYILVEHDDRLGSVATVSAAIRDYDFNIRHGMVNLQGIKGEGRNMMILPVDGLKPNEGIYQDRTVPDDLIRRIQNEMGEQVKISLIDLRSYGHRYQEQLH